MLFASCLLITILRSETAQYSNTRAANMNFVFWDESLSMISQDAANKCDNNNPSYSNFLYYQHQHSKWKYPSIGGLISYRSTSIRNENISISLQLISLLDEAYNNNNNYSYSIHNTSSNNDYIMFEYLAWSELRYFGCGYKICSGNISIVNGIMFYCTLFYIASIDNNYPWIAGKPCSQCPIDKQKCWNGLCAYCMSSGYYINDPPQNISDICINLDIDYSFYTNSPTEIFDKDEDVNKSPIIDGGKHKKNQIILQIMISMFVLISISAICILVYTKGKNTNQINDENHFYYNQLDEGL